MKRVVLAYLALMMASYAAAKDFPEGSGDIEIMEAGVYTASEDRTIASLNVATPTGSSDERTVTVFDHTSCPSRTITLTGGVDPQFNIANHYNTVLMRGGKWNFSGILRLGNESSADSGKDAFRTLVVSDGAEISGVTKAYVSYKQGGSELHVSNATFSASTLCVQGAASMTSDLDEKNRGKLIIGENGKVRLSGDLIAQEGTTTSNSRQTSLVRISGVGAELSAANILIGDTSQTRSTVGSQVFIEHGATLSSTADIRLGITPYSYKPELFDLFHVSDSSCVGVNFYCGYGENTVGERAIFTNSTITLSGSLFCGFGAGSHGNRIGIYDCGTIGVEAGQSWIAGRGVDSYDNQIIISNTVVRTVEGVLPGGTASSSNNEVIVAGPLARVEMTTKQKDPLRYGVQNSFRLTDQASLIVEETSLWLFQQSSGSELVVEKGGRLAAAEGGGMTLTIGKLPNSGTWGANNKVIVRDKGTVAIAGLNLGGTNNTLVVDNAAASFSESIDVGYAQNAAADRCGVIVRGKGPKLNASKKLTFENGTRSALRFEIPGGGYSWSDEPARGAPILLSGTQVMTISDDTILEADVSALTNVERGRKMPVVISSSSTITMSETALANANARGAAAKKPYHFSLSEDKKTLYLTAESRGCILVFR